MTLAYVPQHLLMPTKTTSLRTLEDSFLPILQSCISILQLKKIHAHILERSLSQSNFLTTKMVEICDRFKDIDYATSLFKTIRKPNVFVYNAIIRCYVHSSMYDSVVVTYKQMLENRCKGGVLPDEFTYPLVINSCGGLMCVKRGKQVHTHVLKLGFESNLVVGNALLDMYMKCDGLVDAYKVFDEMGRKDSVSWNGLISGHIRLGQMERARELFDEMPYRSVVSWTAMISGYTRVGRYADALDVFREMQMVGVEPDEVSIVSVLPACAHLGALEVGKWIHIYAGRNQLLRSACVSNALIEMYAKCGCIEEAKQLFNQMNKRDVISWSTIICGLANHGKAWEAIELFREMQRTGVEPNGVTYIGVLSACAHAGLLNEGLWNFESMRRCYGLEPDIEHYGCLVDLLGRSGCLQQALYVIEMMPMEADSKIWGALLSSCRMYGDLKMAVVAMEHLVQLEPHVTGNFVQLANLYADLGKTEHVSWVRKIIRSRRLKKTPGMSLVEVNNTVEEFVSGDDSKPFYRDVKLMLELLESEVTISREQATQNT